MGLKRRAPLLLCIAAAMPSARGCRAKPCFVGPSISRHRSSDVIGGFSAPSRSVCCQRTRTSQEAKRGGGDWDEDMKKATKKLEQMEARKDRKRETSRQIREASAAPAPPPKQARQNPLAAALKSPFGKDEPVTSKFGVSDVTQAEFLGSFNEEPTSWPEGNLPEIAFLGRSNVGKSSMLNALFGDSVARVSKTPGRTQQLNLFAARDAAGRDRCWLADLPGYGYAKIGKDSQRTIELLLERYLRERRNLRLLVLLVDARREPLAADAAILGFAAAAGAGTGVPYRVLVAATKVDKLGAAERAISVRRLRDGLELPEEMPLEFSSVTGKGTADLWRYIRDACQGS